MNNNLDALIPREDFEVKDGQENPYQSLPALQVRDLEANSFVYRTLRKPDFQRETSEWSPEKVCNLIQSFLDGDLIPAVIFWNSGGYNFVIDGAHRLSAIIAWVLDDFGDGNISKAFFGYNISQDQIEAADKTRRLIKKKFGTYNDHLFAINNPEKAEPSVLERAKKLATLTIQLQWVRGDSSKAEASFFKINEQASPINDTEKQLLKLRKKPNAIASRAIIRSGTGHKYWSKFDATKQSDIETISKEINDILFTPSLQTPIKTLDVPLAGKGYSPQTLTLVLDLVNISNDNRLDVELDDDNVGDIVIKMLKRTRKILFRISGSHSSSLGLHPVVYFYSITGRYQVSAFLAVLELMIDFEKRDFFKNFIIARQRFEDFLIKYKSIINQIVFKFGSGLKSYRRIHRFFILVIEEIINGKTDSEILETLKSSEFSFLTPQETELEITNRKEFSTETKSATFLRDALENPLRCKICNGMIHRNSISIDHVTRKEDGGTGNLENAQLSHPFCNTTVKN